MQSAARSFRDQQQEKRGVMRTFIVPACLLLICVATFGQSDRGTITGTVSDPAGAVVSGAKLRLNGAVERDALRQNRRKR